MKGTAMHADLQRAVLTFIAIDKNVDPELVSLGAKGAVFHRRGDQLLCLCQKGSLYWNDAEAKVITLQTIARATGK